MSKQILLLGTSNFQHLYNYIRIVLKDVPDGEIVILNTSYAEITLKEIKDFYKERKIKIVNIPNPMIIKNKYLKSLLLVVESKKQLKQLGEFDYCLIHYISWQHAYLSWKFRKNFRRIVPITYGSDILRSKKLKSRLYQRLFDSAHRIVFNTNNMKESFEKVFNKKYADKSEIIYFPTSSFGLLENMKKDVSVESLKNHYSLPQDKLIVLCGHTATVAERYEKMIVEIAKCNKLILEKCHFVFFMTYGPGNIKPYRDKIKALLKNQSFRYTIQIEYLAYNDILKYHLISDIHITTIETDAFSFFLQEELFTGSAVIYGKWLNYIELFRYGFKVFPFDGFEELSTTITQVVERIDMIKEETMKNEHLIAKLTSEEATYNNWKNKIF